MKKNIIVFFLLVILSSIVVNIKSASCQESLYKRLGGYDAIAAVADDFIGRMAADHQLSRFFVGISTDSQKKLRQHFIDLVCNSTGGPCLYTGRDMTTIHTGLKITESDWDVMVKLFIETLDKFNVQTKEKEELLGVVGDLKSQVVGL